MRNHNYGLHKMFQNTYTTSREVERTKLKLKFKNSVLFAISVYFAIFAIIKGLLISKNHQIRPAYHRMQGARQYATSDQCLLDAREIVVIQIDN